MAEPVLLVEDRDRVRTLTLHRPDRRNALDQELWYALRDGIVEAARDETVSCVVLTGSGKAFCAGQDLAEMADPSVFEDREPGYRALMPELEAFPKPLLAAVNGVGVGFGLTVLLHCDLVLIDEQARLKAPFASLGVTTEASASLLLPMAAGWQEAAHLLFTEPWVDAAEAVRLGLALRLVPAGTVVAETQALAATIAAFPLSSLMATKQLLVAGRADAVRAAREREEAAFEVLVGAAMAAGTPPGSSPG
ncbi:MAG: enoyl-CoA hydratase-related protein [Acidimicrobiales bacterium]|jgi:enoyl-CoA hydratase/carnithine racemase|nr:enoyl-CoA hydratase-related protein [Acidimicrobiales bacterium]